MTIERRTRFRRDFKREKKVRYRASLEIALTDVLLALASDAQLSDSYRDHPLSGKWSDFSDCHVKPDLVLINENAWRGHFAAGAARLASQLGW